MGKAALSGLPGVVTINNSFSGFREVNTVVYDPARIGPQQMVSALQKAGTYLGQVE